jgi:hypothetical protein
LNGDGDGDADGDADGDGDRDRGVDESGVTSGDCGPTDKLDHGQSPFIRLTVNFGLPALHNVNLLFFFYMYGGCCTKLRLCLEYPRPGLLEESDYEVNLFNFSIFFLQSPLYPHIEICMKPGLNITALPHLHRIKPTLSDIELLAR